MPTQANISRWKIALGTTASPPVYEDIEEVFSISGFGKTNNLVDVTSFDSPAGAMEYIAGLADGQEITIECRRIPRATPDTKQEKMIAAVNAQVNRSFQLRYVGVSPSEKWTFSGVPLSWVLTPSPTEANGITFTVKISGSITES